MGAAFAGKVKAGGGCSCVLVTPGSLKAEVTRQADETRFTAAD